MRYPLKVELHKADYTIPDPTSSVESHIVKARYDEENGFIVIDPLNGNEMDDVYESIEKGASSHDTSYFYWVGAVIRGDDPREE